MKPRVPAFGTESSNCKFVIKQQIRSKWTHSASLSSSGINCHCGSFPSIVFQKK
jgi:hypothetical protein